MEKLIKESHRRRHWKLHEALDELLADFITHTKALPSKTPIIELVKWSFNQTLKPSETEEPPCPKKN